MSKKIPVARAIHILTTSFDDNKSVNYVVKQDAKRVERIEQLMVYALKVSKAFGQPWVSGDQNAFALVVYPHQRKSTLSSLMWDLDLALKVVGLGNVPKVARREKLIHENLPKTPFAHLWFVGVAPEAQGHGVGTKFLQEILNHYDNEQLPVYLETSTERNLPLYQRLGFETYNTIDLSFPLYQMRRPVGAKGV